MDDSEQKRLRERKLLYAAVALLAVAVAYLAWTIGRLPSDTPANPTNGADDTTKAPPTELAGDLASQHTDIRERVDGLYPHIASVVGGAIENSTCLTPETSPDGCPATPSLATSVVSNFTLLYENARLNDDEDITVESVGVRLAPRHVRRLEKLANAFKACQQDVANTVKFRVTGYSSTAKFQRETSTFKVEMSKSDALNLKTANLRAAVVADYLRTQDFEVESEPWDSFPALRRPYLDDSPPGTDKEALNRTVFIEVLHAGACDLGRLPRPAR